MTAVEDRREENRKVLTFEMAFRIDELRLLSLGHGERYILN